MDLLRLLLEDLTRWKIMREYRMASRLDDGRFLARNLLDRITEDRSVLKRHSRDDSDLRIHNACRVPTSAQATFENAQTTTTLPP